MSARGAAFALGKARPDVAVSALSGAPERRWCMTT
jgi:hypothetical protein